MSTSQTRPAIPALYEPFLGLRHFQGLSEAALLASVVKKDSESSRTFKVGYSIQYVALQPSYLKFQAQEF